METRHHHNFEYSAQLEPIPHRYDTKKSQKRFKIISPLYFFIFARNLPKILSTRSRKIMTSISLNYQEGAGKASRGSQYIVQSFGETYFSMKFHHFCAKYFSRFRNFPTIVLDTVTSVKAHTLQKYYYICNLSGKNNYSQNKLATPKKSQK